MHEKSFNLARTWVFTIITFAVIVVTFNVVMDPYLRLGMPRIPRFNARKPACLSQQMLMKLYDVVRGAPKTVIAGSSETHVGMDAMDSSWPTQTHPVYNLSFGGGTPYMSFRYLEHAMAYSPISLVVLGLDVGTFLTDALPERPKQWEFESRFAVTPDGARNPEQARQAARDFVQSIISLTAFTDSVTTLIANLTGDSPDSVAGNIELSSSERKMWGSYRSFILGNLRLLRILRVRSDQSDQYELAMADVRAILNLCRSRGVHVILMISPMHADRLDIMDYMGYWPAFENWKRDIVTLAGEYSLNGSGSDIPLWDFSGYDGYSTESVPRDGHDMQWYMDPFHYSQAMGHQVISRIFGSGDPNFGTLLTHENLEAHLAEIREQQRQYRRNHPADVQRARNLYDGAFNMPFLTAQGR